MAKLRTRRPLLDPDAFIAAAEATHRPEQAAVTPAPVSSTQEPKAKASRRQGREDGLPWDRPDVRPDVTKPFNLRVPEPVKLKLDFIRQQTRVSVHEFIMTALLPAVEKEIDRLQHQHARTR